MYGRHGMDETGWKWSTADQDADHNALFKKKNETKNKIREATKSEQMY